MRYKEFIKENIAPIPPLATNKNTVNQIPQANTSGPDNLSQAISQVDQKPPQQKYNQSAVGTAIGKVLSAPGKLAAGAAQSKTAGRFAAGFNIGKSSGGAGTGSVDAGSGLKADYAAQGPERTAFEIYKNMQTGVYPTGIEQVAGTPDYNKIQSMLRSPPEFWKQHVHTDTSPYISPAANTANKKLIDTLTRASGGQKGNPTGLPEVDKILKAAGAI
jgi:hypothetical protein